MKENSLNQDLHVLFTFIPHKSCDLIAISTVPINHDQA